MATLGTMKARIADELAGRADLLPQIEAAIRSAVLMHAGTRWWFCDALLTPTLPAGVDTLALAEDVLAIDGLRCQDGGRWINVRQRSMDEIEFWRDGASRGVPRDYAWFGGLLRFDPVPVVATPLRIQAAVAPELAAGDAAAGPWMTTAEDLIRHTAAADVLANVVMDQAMAAMRAQQAQMAAARLRARRMPAATGRVSGSYL